MQQLKKRGDIVVHDAGWKTNNKWEKRSIHIWLICGLSNKTIDRVKAIELQNLDASVLYNTLSHKQFVLNPIGK